MHISIGSFRQGEVGRGNVRRWPGAVVVMASFSSQAGLGRRFVLTLCQFYKIIWHSHTYMYYNHPDMITYHDVKNKLRPLLLVLKKMMGPLYVFSYIVLLRDEGR